MSTADSTTAGLTPEQVSSFWSKIIKAPNGCWPWSASKTPAGYGQVMYNCRKFSTHRLAWILTHGQEVPAGMFVCHHCDNPSCCNAAHLFLGSQTDNCRDAARKGRVPFGTSHKRSKLNPEKVRLIRQLYRDGLSPYVIARRFGIVHMTVRQVVRRVTWRHVLD